MSEETELKLRLPVEQAQTSNRLNRRDALRPVKAVRVAFDSSLSPRDAAHRIVDSCLAHLQANEAGVIASDDPEFVHQMRVAIRRLRSALRVFRGIIGKDFLDDVTPGLRWLGRMLGEARDWDVFHGETLPPLVTAYGDKAVARHISDAVKQHRDRARTAMREALESGRYARVIFGVWRWIAEVDTAPPVAEPPVTLMDFASRAVRRRHKRVLDQARRLGSLSELERHGLRLATKQLRYAVEFFSPLFPAASVMHYLRQLEKIQSTLGAANDAANALRMIAAVETPTAFAAFSRGWFLGRAENHLERSCAVFARLRRAPQLWDDKPFRGLAAGCGSGSVATRSRKSS